MKTFRPTVSSSYAKKIKQWQDNVHAELKNRQTETVEFLGRVFTIPKEVHPITGMSDLLGNSVLNEVKPTDSVLDMGTGCGVNAILAASKSKNVVAVDINPYAIASAKQNAVVNKVADRIRFAESDVFEGVAGTFDLIIFDPPFRWFKPRDIYEVSSTDEDYNALTTFFAQVRAFLNDGGRILLCFGTSGDLDYVYQLISKAGFDKEIIAERSMRKEGIDVHYYTFKLTKPSASSR